METRQLALISDEPAKNRDWRLDEHTRQVGLKGVATARQALREALSQSRERDEHEPTAA